MLILNRAKREFSVFSPKENGKKHFNLRINVGSSYINYSMTLIQPLLFYANVLLYNKPLSLSLSLSDKPSKASAELMCMFGDRHSQN